MLNMSALFYTTSNDNQSFIDELDLLQGERNFIEHCKNLIRKTLRESLKIRLSEELRKKGLNELTIEPKFFIQGSWAYKTLNRPYTTPPQQSDLDDGLYLPLSIMKESERPSIASSIFFKAAENALEPLAKVQGWEMCAKSTCIRIIVSSYAHIDLPLYAIPDKDFVQLKAAMESSNSISMNRAMDSANDKWPALPSDHILLAHREHNWIKSDPRAMNDWFELAVKDCGEQLRRVVRYLKAFRDKTWEFGGPSSILLMAAVVQIFEERKKRDDLALEDVLKKLPNILRAGVSSPIDSDCSLTDPIKNELDETAKKFEEFYRYISGAINSTDKQTACNWVRHVLGNRFPNTPSLIIAASVADTVQASPEETGPNEIIKNTKAG
ncbi:CBASS cGAMP synthase [Marinomonas polaris]|uniref:CBASS cGAMP synthase n=1 Tax=Marinomonas polaris TaxID=293552 RepID=UPI003F98FB8C